MKKFLAFFAVAALAIVGCSKPATDPTPSGSGLSFKVAKLSLFVDEKSDALELNGLQEGEKVTWTSEDKTIATVTSKGVVTGKKAGNTTIVATSKTDPSRTASLPVEVSEKPADYVDISSVIVLVNGEESYAVPVTMKEGNTLNLSAKIYPDNATDKEEAMRNLTWIVDNSGVLEISPSGVVTAKKAGEGSVTAKVTYMEGKKEKAKEIAFKVTSSSIPATSIRLSSETLRVTIGSTSDIYATILPEDNTDNLSVTWTSSAPSVATVSEGHVTGVSVGEAVITAKAGNLSATCEVTVVEEVVPVQKKVINFTKVFFPVTFPEQYDILDEVTFETWIKIAGSTGNQSIMGIEGVLLLRTESSQWQLIYGGNVKSNQEYEEKKLATSYNNDLSKWTHVAAVYSRSQNYAKLYVNGVEKGSGTLSDHGVNMNGITKNDGTKVGYKLPFTFIIGNACDGGRYLRGNVAYMRVWKKALTASEINSGMNNAAPSSNDVIANWKFDDAQGDTVKDSGPLGLTLSPKTYKDNGGSGATASNNIMDSTIEWIDGELPY